MTFPLLIRHRKATVTIYGKPYRDTDYRITFYAGTRHTGRSFSSLADTRINTPSKFNALLPHPRPKLVPIAPSGDLRTPRRGTSGARRVKRLASPGISRDSGGQGKGGRRPA